jgi:hypothetical protein
MPAELPPEGRPAGPLLPGAAEAEEANSSMAIAAPVDFALFPNPAHRTCCLVFICCFWLLLLSLRSILNYRLHNG